MKRQFLCLLAVVCLSCFAGCATTTDPDEDVGSDIPWNVPQSWEGTIVPGGMPMMR